MDRESVSSTGRALAWLILLGAVYTGLLGVGSQRWTVARYGMAGLALAGLLWLVAVRVERSLDWQDATAKVLKVTPRPFSGTTARCELTLTMPSWHMLSPVTVVDYHVPWTKWPEVGASLPVKVDRRNRGRVRVLWEQVTTADESLPSHLHPGVRYDDLYDDNFLEEPGPAPWRIEPEPPPAPGRQES
ncbi:hypothetical protein [Actinoplanes sp. NPDC049681]|uniref:hypothetical protein n=1 Tax=Actinoplanes sp. NPDC049681 TaxID=3363905 RepID=UPI00379CB691